MLQFKNTAEQFKEFIRTQGIECLIHFTPTKNLYSILEHKNLMSRAKLESLDIEQFDILDYVKFTDEVRYDDKNYINLSISFPNTFLFSKFQARTKDDLTITWCVIKINPIYLYVQETLFAVTNAASNSAKRQFGISGDIEKLKMLFSNEFYIKKCYDSIFSEDTGRHRKNKKSFFSLFGIVCLSWRSNFFICIHFFFSDLKNNVWRKLY